MKTEHDSFLAYYLTQDDDSALRFKETRFALSPYEIPEEQEVSLGGSVQRRLTSILRRQYITSYETMKQSKLNKKFQMNSCLSSMTANLRNLSMTLRMELNIKHHEDQKVPITKTSNER